MKKTVILLLITSCFASCRNNNPIVDILFTDSLINNYTEPAAVKANAAEINFWGNRINPKQPAMTNELKYAAALMGRFRLTGNISDIKTADSILRITDSAFNHKEAYVKLAIAKNQLLQHRFTLARNIFLDAATGLEPFDYYSSSFDINFELDNNTESKASLAALQKTNEYDYYFRQSKWEHLQGDADKAIEAMQKATELSGTNIYLKQAALSNTADLYLHTGELQKANDLYMRSVRLDASDLHSMMGLAWIAMVHDKNYLLAEKIFSFVSIKTKSPEPLYKMVQLAEAKEDTAMQKKYAAAFEQKVSDTLYGNMYNKYMIDLYTGILNNAAAAEAIAAKELQNRATPQTYTWYAYSLFKNNKAGEAFKIYKQHIAGKPLEALELYWIGKLMQGLNKNYNAAGYFKAAYKNKYDLSPAKAKDLETIPGIK